MSKTSTTSVTTVAFFPLGLLFGFVLSRAGATTYDYYAGLFLFSDLQLLWVIAAGAATGAVGIALLKKVQAKTLLSGEAIEFAGKPYKRDLIPGALLLGMGWGLAGACPGTLLAMLGEGKGNGLFTLFGVMLGTWLYGVMRANTQNSSQGVVAPD
ncbi:MAG TPA: hypothetical protein DCQ06_02030 [Myxococcales bacterium]|nr:hypothetical protein [Myxococcales bacterium]HAN30352.1 hypothetical protein [Myxococcales bacterium]